MDIGEAFTNPEVEREGVWTEYRDGSKIKIARIGNPNFNRIHEAKLKPHRRKQRDGTLSSELETKILCEVIAETILLDWEGFNQDGKEFKFTKKAAYDLLHKHIDFRNEIVELAAAEATFHADFTEDSAKN
jgi:hypothetical protein